jgi:hypothetical protein
MWLFTTSGFISIVEKDANHLAVRARDSLSLSSLAQSYDVEIRSTPTADYPYRIFLSKDQFKNYLHNQAGLINYKNFKSEVAITRGKKFSTTLLSVWSAMHEVEDKKARSKDENR